MPTHYEGNKRETQVLNAFIKLTRASESINARLSRYLSEEKLTISQFGVLEALLHLGPQSQKELGKKLLKSGGNITLVIDNLLKRSYIERVRDPNDGRAVVISLSDEGRAFIERYFPIHLQHIIDEFKDLTLGDLEQLADLSKKVGFPPK